MNSNKNVLIGILLLLLLSWFPPSSRTTAQPLQLSTIYTVTNTNNDGIGSLRQALVDARDHSGLDYIYFDIPTTDSGYSPPLDVWFIKVTTVLRIEDADGVEIYGATQDTTNAYLPAIVIEPVGTPAGANLLTVLTDHNKVFDLGFFNSTGNGIQVEGESNTVERNQIFTSPYHGINLVPNANSNLIRDNHISGHAQGGIFIENAYTNIIEDNIIGPQPAYITTVPRNGGDGIAVVGGAYNIIQNNIISHNIGHGIRLSLSTETSIISNTIGLTADLTSPLGNNKYGIYIEGRSNFISNNWISANAWDGIRLHGADTNYNRMQKNKIGISFSGLAPNQQHGIGIYDGANDNYIGNAADASESNMIAGNDWSGVAIVDSPLGSNDIHFNYILYNGYYGVNIVNSPENNIIDNKIIGNGELATSAGVRIENTSGEVDRSDRNLVFYNSIAGNSGKGIELTDDANIEIDAPTIFSASCTNVLGTTTPTCGTTCQVQIFSDSEDEGFKLEGTVTTVGGGNFSWSGFLDGPNVTATVNDALGNTSEFSLAKVNACLHLYLPLIMN